MTTLDFTLILPEILLAGWALLGLMLGAYLGKDRISSALLWATVAVLLVVVQALQAGGDRLARRLAHR